MALLSLNPAVPFIIKIAVDLIVGAAIRNPDPAKEAAKATTAIAIANAVVTLNAGDITAGLEAIDAATGAAKLDAAESAALHTAIGFVATKAAAVQQFLSGSITGAAVSQIVAQVAAEVISVAQKYLPASAPK